MPFGMEQNLLKCEACAGALSKGDANFVDEETFAFYAKMPEGISAGAYCHSCFEAKVRPALDEYNDLMERARNVNMFYLSQSKESRFVRRTEKPVRVKDCLDRDEAILRLAFLAVQAGKNALVDVDLSTTKVRNFAYQSSLWHGQAIPANITESALNRRFLGAPN